mmetsp:Transcript_2405/g.8578  ORF Transcript_2405/g.8578 Transcript_2405/m.8578 type:complete len:359 (+) Transcript_2405:37-1113(+)
MDSALWVDRYRPRGLEKLEIHTRVNDRLKKMVASGDLPHLMFYGPSGAGKKTRVIAVLRELYGPAVEKVKVEQRTFKFTTPSRATVEMSLLSSMHHVELTPADAGTKDVLIVQSIVKEFASSAHITDVSQKRGFKLIVLNEVDRLSKRAQHALRRTMETSTAGCRLVLCSSSSGKVIGPLRSRCLLVRVPAPTNDEIKAVLERIAKREGFQMLDSMTDKIIEASGRNLRKAILCLEATKATQFPFTERQQPQVPAWEDYVCMLAKDVMEQQTPGRLQEVRTKLYELLSHCIPATLILKRLTIELVAKVDPRLARDVAHWAAFYEHRLQTGNKEIFHLEGFVAKFMSLQLQLLLNEAMM